MYDLLLIYPQVEIGAKVSRKNFAFGQPNGTFSIASYLDDKGYKVKLLDLRLFQNPTQVLMKYVKNSKIIGLTVMTAQLEHSMQISKLIKSRFPEKLVVWGGIHPSLYPEQVSEKQYIDYVIKGEGEKPMLHLVKKGKSKNKIIEGEFLTIDEIPKFNYDLLPIDKYINSEFDGKRMRKLDYSTSRGCLFRCTFCINTVLWQRKYRALPAKRVLDDIEEMVKKYRLNALWFIDEDMFTFKDRTTEILQGIIDRKLNIIWKTNNRVSYFRDNYINDDFVKLMYDAGCREISHGVESGSKRIRDKLIVKDIKEEQVINSAKLYYKHGIRPEYSFMCSFPTETKKDFFATMDLIDKIKKVNPEAVILGPQSYRPYPGGKLYDLAVKMGYKEPKTMEEWVKETDQFVSSVNPAKFPWVKKHMVPYYENSGKFATIGTREFKQIWQLSKAMVIPWVFSRLRWKLRYFKYPIEWKLYKFVSKIIPFY